MRCHGDRCAALVGAVGQTTRCAVYAARPDVCHACMAGDDACRMARRHFGLAHDAGNNNPKTTLPATESRMNERL